MKRSILLLGGCVLIGGMLTWPSLEGALRKPTSATGVTHEDERKCEVCGMFLAPYRDWLASIRFRDGLVVSFDGVKDLFKYYFDINRYHPGRALQHVESVQVTEYYSLRPMDGYRSHFVIGSDVLGPMGHELIPFATEQAAIDFLRDHHGERVLTFAEVTRDTIARLDTMPPRPKR